jgi:hypothetical protein
LGRERYLLQPRRADHRPGSEHRRREPHGDDHCEHVLISRI